MYVKQHSAWHVTSYNYLWWMSGVGLPGTHLSPGEQSSHFTWLGRYGAQIGLIMVPCPLSAADKS